MAHRSRRQRHGDLRAWPASGVDAGQPVRISAIGVRSSFYALTASSLFALDMKACIMPRIGLLRYSGTAPLNQMRYTVQAIPTFGSVGLDHSKRGYPVSTVPAPDNQSSQFARPAITARPARISGRDVAC